MSVKKLVKTIDSISFSLISELNYVNDSNKVLASLSKEKATLLIALNGLLPQLKTVLAVVMATIEKTKADTACKQPQVHGSDIRIADAFSSSNVNKYASALMKNLLSISSTDDYAAKLSYAEIKALKTALRCLLPRVQESIARLSARAKVKSAAILSRNKVVHTKSTATIADVVTGSFPVSDYAMPALQAER